MDDTDAVLVAGGDGTLMEAVTGLLRRKDINVVSRSLPLGLSAQHDTKCYIRILIITFQNTYLLFIAFQSLSMTYTS